MSNYRTENKVELIDREGDPVYIDLPAHLVNPMVFRFVEDARGWLHCYTLYRDTKGRFWAWSYKPIGKGARSNRATEFAIWKPRSSKRRVVAKNIARQRHDRHPSQLPLFV